MIGDSIHGYTLKRKVGSGGMAGVYYSVNELGKGMAIKVIKKKFADETSVLDRFKQEAKIMVDLQHPYIRKVYDIGKVNGRPAIIMEYLEGKTLKETIEIEGSLSPELMRNYFLQCAKALHYTHGKGVIHRDIKPSNLFITDAGIKLTDFGIARIKEGIGYTQTGQTLGTIQYMSPEQVKDPKRVDHKTDVYSLGVTFLHALKGKSPYDLSTDSAYKIQTKIVNEPIEIEDLPREWSTLLSECLRKDPEKRPELKELIEKIDHTLSNVDDEATQLKAHEKKENEPGSQSETELESEDTLVQKHDSVGHVNEQAQKQIENEIDSLSFTKQTILVTLGVFVVILVLLFIASHFE